MARWRDRRMGANGDLWHRSLIDPAVRRVVGPVRGLRVVDVACGNGYLARRMARAGAATVVGFDRSAPNVRIARGHERNDPTGARFEVADAARLPLPTGTTDLVVANMALMDIADARGAIREAARVLGPNGRFVFSIAHPCFDLDDRSLWSVERGFGTDGIYRATVWRKVRGYRVEGRSRIPWEVSAGRIVWTESFHRTLSTYSGYLRAARLVVTRLEEPWPLPEIVAKSPQGTFLTEIPLHLVVEAVPRAAPTRGSRTRQRSRAGASRRSGSGARTPGTGSRGRGSTTVS